MTTTIAREPAPTLFPMEAKPSCPRCGSRYLIEDADPDLLSCPRCYTWLRRGALGALIPTSVPPVDTKKLELPWRAPA